MRITDFFIDWFLMVFTLPVPVFFVICFIIALFIPEIKNYSVVNHHCVPAGGFV